MMDIQPWEPRVSRLEGAFEQLPERLNDLRSDMTTLREDMNRLRGDMRGEMGDMRGEIGSLRDSLDRHFRWTMGTMVALVAALGAFLHLVR